MGASENAGGNSSPQIIHLVIGISIFSIIHFGGFPPILGNAHNIYNPQKTLNT